MFGVVVDEHVVWHGQHVTIHVDCSGHHHLLWTQPSGLFRIFNFSWKITASLLDFYLEPPHVSRVSCIFQTVLIALEEELQEESERCVDKTGKKKRNTISFIWTVAQNGREPEHRHSLRIRGSRAQLLCRTLICIRRSFTSVSPNKLIWLRKMLNC